MSQEWHSLALGTVHKYDEKGQGVEEMRALVADLKNLEGTPREGRFAGELRRMVLITVE